jgi:hypothetical protein
MAEGLQEMIIPVGGERREASAACYGYDCLAMVGEDMEEC